MILIGMYDSPFVRRVAIAMRLYGMDYEHRPWSTFRDADRIADYSPLLRVPVLVLDDGEVLIESAAILDWLDEQVGPEKALIAAGGTARRRALKSCALATGLADKVVADGPAVELMLGELVFFGLDVVLLVERLAHVEVVAPAGEFEAVVAPLADHFAEFLEGEVGPLAGEQGDRPRHRSAP